MMGYDFDKPVSRRGTDSIKWDLGVNRSDYPDLLPLWVADMDFTVAEPVREALSRRVDHAVFGYSQVPDSYWEAYRAWALSRLGWEIEADWLVYAPGVLPVMALAVQLFTKPGEKVVIQPPVYPPFKGMVESNGRQVVENPLLEERGRYRIDFDHLDSVIDERTRLLLFCSPHNPVGRVWSRDELAQVADVARRHDLIIISDEIHCDLLMPGARHIPLPLAGAAERTVVLTSPSKTFNLAGLAGAQAVIPDPTLRSQIEHGMRRGFLHFQSVLSVCAGEAAYRHGAEWLDQLLGYIHANYRTVRERLNGGRTGISVGPTEGTYLAWLDFAGTGLSDAQAHALLLEKAGVWLNEGVAFGTGGSGHQRMNLATARSTVEEALTRIERAL